METVAETTNSTNNLYTKETYREESKNEEKAPLIDRNKKRGFSFRIPFRSKTHKTNSNDETCSELCTKLCRNKYMRCSLTITKLIITISLSVFSMILVLTVETGPNDSFKCTIDQIIVSGGCICDQTKLIMYEKSYCTDNPSKKCEDNGLIYQASSSSCKKDCENPGIMTDKQREGCICTDVYEVWMNQKCVDLKKYCHEKDQMADFSTKSCSTCIQGYTYSRDQMKCVANEKTQEEKKNNIAVIIAVVCVAVLLIVAIAVFLIFKKKQNKPNLVTMRGSMDENNQMDTAHVDNIKYDYNFE